MKGHSSNPKTNNQSSLRKKILVFFGVLIILKFCNELSVTKEHSNIKYEKKKKILMLDNEERKEFYDMLGSDDTVKALVTAQIAAHEQFQKMLLKLQVREVSTPDERTRLLVVRPTDRVMDGFALEVQTMGRLLQVALSTNRTLVISPEWRSAYEPPDCQSKGWDCLWEPVSKVDFVQLEFGNQNKSKDLSDSDFLETGSSSVGIFPNRAESQYFDVHVYGNDNVVDAPSWRWEWTQLTDVVPHWERIHGRFWVRAQMVHFLWRPSNDLMDQIQERWPPELMTLKSPANHSNATSKTDNMHQHYIAFHIRYTDNIGDLNRDFGRDAMVTRSFDRFMKFANAIRDEHPDIPINTIVLATDSTDMVKESQRQQWKVQGWNFLLQNDVQRSDSKSYLWFGNGRSSAAPAIATDLELMRRADFLVGSFQSNVYRLAAELNSAWNVYRYPIHIRRHFTVDVEWFEDP